MQDQSSEARIPKKRLFIAASLPEKFLQMMAAKQTEIKRYAKDAKWVKPHGIHLTLKFLGYVDQLQIPEIIDRLDGVCRNVKTFDVEVSGFGFFPNSRRPNVLWVGIQSSGLSNLQRDVEGSMSKLGFEKENRAFSPHLTLARFKTPKGLEALTREVESQKETSFGKFSVTDFHLFESILHRDGATYSSLKTFPFGNSNA